MATKIKKNFKATQEFVPIKEVRDGIVILKDGSMRAILMTSSINFALKSEEEQIAILAQFQNFLNSIEFSIQIFVQSRDLDIRPYVAKLEELYKQQSSDLMRIQTKEYVEFVKSFVQTTNIMVKRFFIVVPYSRAVISTGKGGFSGLSKGGETTEEMTAHFEENRSQIEQRVSVIEQGLARTGVRIVNLGTEEIIELFYKLFNPGDLSKPISLKDEPKNL
jgi:type IV secretory pathway VirB4 component